MTGGRQGLTLRLALAALAVVAATPIHIGPASAAPVTEVSSSRSAPCLPSLLPLPTTPREAHRLSSGVALRVHELRQPATGPTVPRRAFISILQVRHNSAVVAPVTAGVPLLLHPSEPLRQRSTLAVVNGDYFEALRRGDAVPTGALVTGGVPRYVPQGYTDVVAVGSDGLMRKTKVQATGRATTAEAVLTIGAINDPLADADVAVAFTADWKRAVPTGRRALVVEKGTVMKVASPTSSPRVPEGGVVITLPDSASAEAFPRSSAITIDLGVSALDGRDVVSASGHGGAFLVDGRVVPACSDYENLLRPRTVLAWNDAGDTWLMTASTRQKDPPGGVRVGGATKTQLAQIARSLGATWAVTMDGGGSTSLYARIAGQPRRIDLAGDAWARPVPVLWTVSTPR